MCKQCTADAARLRYLSVSRDKYRAMLAAQGGVCAVCKGPDPSGRALAVDHDHRCCPERGKSCGKCIRGLLCGPCNMSIGHMGDNADRLRAAAAYLDAA
ncbi:endonuclease domain-containing protein [Streptomyces scabiei]